MYNYSEYIKTVCLLATPACTISLENMDLNCQTAPFPIASTGSAGKTNEYNLYFHSLAHTAPNNASVRNLNYVGRAKMPGPI